MNIGNIGIVVMLWIVSLILVGYFSYGLGGRDEAYRQLRELLKREKP